MSKINLRSEYYTLDADVLAYEGELMEVGIQIENNIQIGDFLICEYMSQELETRVIKRTNNQLWLFVPYQAHHVSNERRQHIRYQSNIPGLLINEDNTISVTIVDFNPKGFGLQLATDEIQIGQQYYLMVRSELLSIIPKIVIAHHTQLPEGSRFGSEIITIKSEDYKHLRVYLMFQRLLNR